jgi:MFS family permease
MKMSDAISKASPTPHHRTAQVNSPARVLIASLVGTTIEFFDFYVYATAAVLVFPHLFFPASDPTPQRCSLVHLLDRLLRPSYRRRVFGHFGDRIGRKATLVAALMTMGLSTV